MGWKSCRYEYWVLRKWEALRSNWEGLDETVDKVKTGAKAVVNKVGDTSNDLGSEYKNEKPKEDLQ